MLTEWACRPKSRRLAHVGQAWAEVPADTPATPQRTVLKLPRTYWFDRSLLALLIATTAWLSLTLARGPGELSAIWIGNGILAGWLLSRRTATWPGYLAVAFAAELPARLLAGDGLVYALAIIVCNLLEVLILASAVRSRIPDVRAPEQWTRLGGIATVATLLACAVSGVLAASVSHVMNAQPLLQAFTGWYAAHVVGMVVVATMTLVAQREGVGLFAAAGRRWDLVATLALVTAVSIGVFLSGYPVLFLTYPALLLAAARHQFAGVALGVIAVALVAATATALGLGPLWRADLDDDARIALIQIYLAGGCIMTIPLSLAMADRTRLARRLGDSERRYRMLADHSHDVISRVAADGRLLYISPSATEMFGWEPGRMPESRWDIIHPEDRERQRQALAEVLANGGPRVETYRIRHRDGHYLWIEAVSRRIPSEDPGSPAELMLSARDISERVAAEQALAESRRELERLSREDSLTGLANRRHFDDRLALALKRLKRHGTPLVLMSMDVDHFKQVNDTHGHAAGDAVLCAFADRLCDSVRETDLVARVGGDEFAILIEDAAPGSGEAVATKLLEAMRQPIEAEGKSLVVGTSIGVAYAREPIDAATLVAAADAALYIVKRAGRNRFHVLVADPDSPAPSSG